MPRRCLRLLDAFTSLAGLLRPTRPNQSEVYVCNWPPVLPAVGRRAEIDDREIFLPNRAGKVERNWAAKEVMQDIVERLEAEGATVVRKKGVIVAVFDED